MSLSLQRIVDPSAVQFDYRSITQHCSREMRLLLRKADRRVAVDAVYQLERAYGVYMGWRALVMDKANPEEFARDDALLESLLGYGKRAHSI